MSREEDVEPDDVPLVADPVDLPVRSLVTAARGPLSVTTKLAGPESVPFGGGSGNSGSVGPLTVGTTMRGSSGHLDPLMIKLPWYSQEFSPTVATPAPVASASALQPPPPPLLSLPPPLSGALWSVKKALDTV